MKGRGPARPGVSPGAHHKAGTPTPAGDRPTANRRRVPRQSRAREKVRRILGAARDLLRREGPAALSTNRVAEAAGVSVGTLYEYFQDKDAVVRAVIDDLAAGESARIVRHLRAVEEGVDLEALVRSTVEITYDLYAGNADLYQALWRYAGESRARVGLRAAEREVLAEVRAHLERHRDRVAAPDLDIATHFAFHLVESLVHRAITTPLFDRHTCVGEITRAVMGYLTAPPPSGRSGPSADPLTPTPPSP